MDWDRVAELRAEIGADGFAEVVALFLEEADEVVARIARQNGAAALESDLHFLKGAALNLGLAEVAELCQDGERRAAAGDTGLDLATVKVAYVAAKQTLKDGLDRLDAA